MTKQATFRIDKIVGIGTKMATIRAMLRTMNLLRFGSMALILVKMVLKSEESSSVGEER